MKINTLLTLLWLATATCLTGQDHPWTTKRILADFHAEGAAVGDVNGDGHTDIAYGPFWIAGPGFDDAFRFTSGDAFIPDRGYSDNFFSYIVDATRDGRNDILVYGFPGKEARLYVNPGEAEGDAEWDMHLVAPEISNESPAFVDIVPGGLPEIVATHEQAYGYYEAGEDATQPWTWRAISEAGDAGGRFEHGLGVGDVNGDGLLDIVQREFWYEHSVDPDSTWKKHRWNLPPQPGGAQILVHDFDGDGDSDIVSSIRAHGFGLAWYEQTEPGRFSRRDIMGESSTDNPHGVCFSQLHALALSDIDGDGRMDFVTGKRYLAHQGKDPGGLQAPVVYWFRNVSGEEGVAFVPHFVDDDSGVGVEVKVADLDGDGSPDIVSGNKRGLAIHQQKDGAEHVDPEPWQVAGGRPQEGYGTGLTAGEALARMEVPEGFAVDLIAAEPGLTQPIAMCFDARGRIWVIEGHTYPERVEGDYHAGKDRIVILEDSDADGSFETRKVFAENINLASGIEVGFGGVYVGAAPYLLFYPDSDGDDQPDGEPEILLDGWGWQDTHETLNAFTWGPDGWLYGCHGVFTHSKVGKPGTPAEERVPLNAAVWRFHPVSHEFEIYAHGTSNPWGVDYDEHGDFFISACVIPHFYHLSQGGRYQRQAGQHFAPYTFDDIKTIADHAHYVGDIRAHAFWGAKKTERPPSPTGTSALGGGHAHCGLALYLADTFPSEYRGDAFFHNLHGHRLVRESLLRDGSGHVAHHRPDFLLANDHESVGVGVMLGPDGALYFSDWVDAQTCHHRDVEIWDRTTGRLYRIRYGAGTTTVVDLPGLSDVTLVATLGHPNAFHARQAQRLLQERSANGSLDRDAFGEALGRFEVEHAGDIPRLLRVLWTRYACGQLSEEQVTRALSDPHEHIRGWAVQFAPENEAILARLAEMARTEDSLVVRRYLASKLQRLPLEQRWRIAGGLIAHPRSGHDRNIPLLCWYGIEPLVAADPARALELVGRTPWPKMKDFLTRRAATFPEGRTAITHSLSAAKTPKEFTGQANQLLTALASLPPVAMPDAWGKAKARGLSFGEDASVQDALHRMGTRFGDETFFARWRGIARDAKARPADRIEAIELLTVGKDPELGEIARSLLHVPALRPVAVAALRRHPGRDTAEALVGRLPEFSLDLRNQAINLLASRPEMVLVLLEAVDDGTVEASLVSHVLLDQFARFENERIDKLIDAHWTRGSAGVDLGELASAIESWKRKLNPRVMAKADRSRGRQVYTVTCGTCHQLFGEGVALGPDLTGSNRADLGYILENVLAPSAVVGRDYLLHVLTLEDGSTVSGMVRSETTEFLTVGMPGGSEVEVKKAEIAKREEIAQSLMPAGLFDALPLGQVADLVAYLGSPNQVPLPGEASGGQPPESAVAPPGEGVIRIEGESLVEKSRPGGGELRTQRMTHFGPGWSGNHHLWWVGGKPDDILTLKLEGLAPGTKNLVIFPTTAKDYATARFAINGQLQEADFYTEKVLPGEPLRFERVNVSPSEPLQIDIHLTGKNEAALPRYMVGIDRIEISDVPGK